MEVKNNLVSLLDFITGFFFFEIKAINSPRSARPVCKQDLFVCYELNL